MTLLNLLNYINITFKKFIVFNTHLYVHKFMSIYIFRILSQLTPISFFFSFFWCNPHIIFLHYRLILLHCEVQKNVQLTIFYFIYWKQEYIRICFLVQKYPNNFTLPMLGRAYNIPRSNCCCGLLAACYVFVNICTNPISNIGQHRTVLFFFSVFNKLFWI